jgi:hypothetical protein
VPERAVDPALVAILQHVASEIFTEFRADFQHQRCERKDDCGASASNLFRERKDDE